MKRSSSRRSLVVFCALACAAAAAVSWWPPANDIRTEDHNGDGRPDVWRAYDRRGQLSSVAVDTNFDGRSDIQEYYDGGALVRRDSDRDFNDRIDLVEEFNPATREHVRSIVDVDYNGTADLLVLFQGGLPVFSKWAQAGAAMVGSGDIRRNAGVAPRTADAQLAPLEDPFSADTAMRAVRVVVGLGTFIGLSTSGGLPASCHATSGLPPAAGVSLCSVSVLASSPVLPRSPRGPPCPLLLA
jgi:hypothetical protein